MRTIQLMNSFFNMNNMFLAHMVMKQAEANNKMSKTQFGSHKNHRPVMAALVLRLFFDYSRQRRQAIICAPEDASQCYDRMNHAPTSLSLRSMGVPDEPVESMFKVLQQAAHHISTAYGVSDDTYGGKERILQGLLATRLRPINDRTRRPVPGSYEPLSLILASRASSVQNLIRTKYYYSTPLTTLIRTRKPLITTHTVYMESM